MRKPYTDCLYGVLLNLWDSKTDNMNLWQNKQQQQQQNYSSSEKNGTRIVYNGSQGIPWVDKDILDPDKCTAVRGSQFYAFGKNKFNIIPLVIQMDQWLKVFAFKPESKLSVIVTIHVVKGKTLSLQSCPLTSALGPGGMHRCAQAHRCTNTK